MNTPARAALSCLLASLPALPPARALEFEPLVDARLRSERTTTPAARAGRDRSYGLAGARLRLGLDLEWKRLTLHGLAQATALDGLPRRAAFGVGPTYLAANGGDAAPRALEVAELALRYRDERHDATLGRQRFADGVELLPGIAFLDDLQRARFGERLIGNWDWVAAGRRFDGVTASRRDERAQISGFYLRPLQGGVNVRGAFSSFDRLEVWGAAVASPYGSWLPRTSLRLQASHYDDERAAARAAAGGEIALDTLVASAVVGDEDDALVVWLARQTGDWGARRHDADAVVLGAGHRFAGAPGEPTLYLGYERASGDSPGTRHRGFFNLLPTNHKFYGSIDYSAFSNLRDVYLEASWKPRPSLRVVAALHDFALAQARDAWYGGSGAYDDDALGFTARRPAGGGRFASRNLGRELDLEVAWSWRPGLDLRAGAARFAGGSAARQALPAAADGTWLFIEVGYRR